MTIIRNPVPNMAVEESVFQVLLSVTYTFYFAFSAENFIVEIQSNLHYNNFHTKVLHRATVRLNH